MTTWHLRTDDATERARFGDPAAALAIPGAPVGPRNRLRSVERIEAGGAVWFRKVFDGTQWKNRARFLLTPPRARDDAERELRVTEALRAAGHGAPVPVACGRAGGRAVYVCRGLPGEAFAARLAAGTATPALARRVAAHCGGLLAAGFALPDLSADHVFVDGAPGAETFAVLDLHNGGLVRPGPASPALLVRVLRRFARSVRGAAVAWPAALRFAVLLVRAAGRGDRARAILRRLPPFATAARYEAPGKSEAYAARNPRRDARERALLARLWPGRPGETVLDLPCGAGRLLPLLRDRFGHRVVQADGALAMLRQARAAAGGAAPHAVAADALAMPFAAGAVDGVVMFRFLHHLPGEARARTIAEACRTARRFVVASFFHPCSFHHLQRKLRQLGGAAPTRFPTTLRALRAEFARHGFLLAAHRAEAAFARDLWLAVFVRGS